MDACNSLELSLALAPLTPLWLADHVVMGKRAEPVILIAEDSPDDVFMFRRAFEQMAVLAPIQVVCNGEEAIAYLKGSGRFSNRQEYPLPDLFLLDLKMPRKSGFEVLDWLRKQRQLTPIRVVVLTTSEEIRDVNEAYKLGAASFLVKPLNFDEFRNTISAMYDYWRTNVAGESSRQQDSRTGKSNGAS
jgi:CheY-like chemotaxis protein